MPSIILTPIAAGSVTDLSPIPVGRPNYQCVNDYPDNLGADSYVYVGPATQEDLYDISEVEDMFVKINSLAAYAICRRTNDIANTDVELSLNPGIATDRSDTVEPTNNWASYSNTWDTNPDTDDFWSVANINAIEAGIRLTSDDPATEVQCTQLYLDLNITILSEIISNYLSPDIIHINQNYSIMLQEEKGKQLYNATTKQIKYKDPNGNEASLDANIVDENRLIAKMPAATNDKTGKWWFKLYAEFASGEILEGVPIFANIQSEWI